MLPEHQGQWLCVLLNILKDKNNWDLGPGVAFSVPFGFDPCIMSASHKSTRIAPFLISHVLSRRFVIKYKFAHAHDCPVAHVGEALRVRARGGRAGGTAGVWGHQAAPSERVVHNDDVSAAVHRADPTPAGEVGEAKLAKRGWGWDRHGVVEGRYSVGMRPYKKGKHIERRWCLGAA